jgi:arginine-tRNA-protein transferase
MAQRALEWAVLADEEHDCSYLAGQTARMPMRLPLARLGPSALDASLEDGDRRAGRFFYRPECRACRACELLRLPVSRLVPSKSQRRVWRANEGEIEARVQPATATERHVEIYNRHKWERGLGAGDPMSVDAYRAYYVASGVRTWEVQYLLGGRMVAFSVLDVGERAVSSVYHAFDPDESRRSLGTYSVLKEVQLFGARGYEWYYLGLWVRDCASLAYKSGYYPHQRKAAGAWREYASADDAAGLLA